MWYLGWKLSGDSGTKHYELGPSTRYTSVLGAFRGFMHAMNQVVHIEILEILTCSSAYHNNCSN